MQTACSQRAQPAKARAFLRTGLLAQPGPLSSPGNHPHPHPNQKDGNARRWRVRGGLNSLAAHKAGLCHTEDRQLCRAGGTSSKRTSKQGVAAWHRAVRVAQGRRPRLGKVRFLQLCCALLQISCHTYQRSLRDRIKAKCQASAPHPPLPTASTSAWSSAAR